MPVGAYPKPPITEAVIALSFEEAISTDVQVKVRDKFAATYPGSESSFQISIELHMDVGGLKPTAKATAQLAGFKLSTSDQLDLIILSAKDFTTSRVAPYLGWEYLFERAKTNHDLLRSVVGYRNLMRVAVRYINRLDIPSALDERIDPLIYLNNLPAYPGVTAKSFSEFSNQVIFDIESIPARARVGANGAPSPLIDHKSLMLDIDVFCWKNLPNKPDAVYELLEFLHQTKNSIFEACITDKARELFDRG